MKKETSLIEFDTEYGALHSYDLIDVRKRQLDLDEKNFAGQIISDYSVMYPVSVSYDFTCNKKGWMCKNTKTKKYKIFLNSSLQKSYLNEKSNASYFGISYVDEGGMYTAFNKTEFSKEFELERKIYMDKHYAYLDVINLLSLYDAIENIDNNLLFFEKISAADYEEELQRIVSKYHFHNVSDVSKIKHCLYILAIDEYKQFYVGKCANGLKNRTQKHWAAKIIPERQFWQGGKDYSRLKVDNFKMFDTKRIFVCEDIEVLISDNLEEASNYNLECDNTFGLSYYENMEPLDKAERIVINNSKCKYCLSDRTPLLNDPHYSELELEYGIKRDDILIKQYNNLDKYKPQERTPELIKFINSIKRK